MLLIPFALHSQPEKDLHATWTSLTLGQNQSASRAGPGRAGEGPYPWLSLHLPLYKVHIKSDSIPADQRPLLCKVTVSVLLQLRRSGVHDPLSR